MTDSDQSQEDLDEVMRGRGRSRSFISEDDESGSRSIIPQLGVGSDQMQQPDNHHAGVEEGDDGGAREFRSRSRSIMTEEGVTDTVNSPADIAAKAASMSRLSMVGGKHLGGLDYDPSRDPNRARRTGSSAPPPGQVKTGNILVFGLNSTDFFSQPRRLTQVRSAVRSLVR